VYIKEDIRMKEKVDEIIDNFDAETVNSIMTQMNWTWNSDLSAPSPSQIKDVGRKLLYKAIDYYERERENIEIHTQGGLMAIVSDGFAELYFCAVESGFDSIDDEEFLIETNYSLTVPKEELN